MNAKAPAILLVLTLVLGALAFVFLSSGGNDEVQGGPGRSGTEQVEPLAPRSTDVAGGSAAEARAPRASTDEPRIAERQAVEAKATKAKADTAPAPKTGPWLTGFVRDMDGRAIPDAEVRVKGQGGAATLFNLVGAPFAEEAKTEGNGSFRVTRNGLLGDEVEVRVRARGYLEETLTLAPSTEEGDAELGEVFVERGVVIGGIVVDANGEPVEGARVDCRLQGERNFRFGRGGFQGEETGADGRFEFAHEAPGSYELIATHEEHPNVTQEIEVALVGLEDTGLYLQFPRSASIVGRVTGVPLSAQYVEVFALPTEFGNARETLGWQTMLEAYSGTSDGQKSPIDANGRFELHGLLEGQNYELMATVPGAMMQRVRASEHKVVRSGVEDVELKWDRGATVKFQLVRAADGNPVMYSTVNYRWEEEDFRGFQMGSTKREFRSSQVEVTELRPTDGASRLNLMVSAPGLLSKRLDDLNVVADEVLDLGKIELEAAPMVRVHVSEAGTSDPIKRARISLIPVLPGDEDMEQWEKMWGEMRPQTTKGKTEKDGWADVANCSSDSAKLRVQASGFGDYEEIVSLSSDAQLEFRVQMQEGADVRISVVDAAGEPSKARIDYEGPGEIEGNGTTSTRGELRLRDMVPGAYRVRARSADDWWADDSDEWQSFNAGPGEKVEVELRLPLASTLTGTVMVNGQPRAGVSVQFATVDEDGDWNMTWSESSRDETDGQGRFELEKVTLGDHELHIAVNEASSQHVVPVHVIAGKNDVNINLTTRTVTGIVTDPNGAPLPGVEVSTSSMRSVDTSGLSEEAAELVSMNRSFLGSDGSVRTDGSGRFSIDGIDAEVEELIVSANKSGYTDASAMLKGSELGKSVELVLQTAGSIRVTVTGNSNETWYMVVAENLETGERENEWGNDDGMVIDSLPPGKYMVYTQRWEDEGQISNKEQAVEVEVRSGERSEVTIPL